MMRDETTSKTVSGVVIAGDHGVAVAGVGGVAIAGVGGAVAGDRSAKLHLTSCHGHTVSATVGQDGIKPNTLYCLGVYGELAEATE